jgi:thiol-disulfide isomerase/thioredoxin
MFGLTAVTVMQAAFLTAAASDYQEAYDRSEEEGKPLLVLVGTEWCPGCRIMKQENIPQLKRAGAFKEVVYTEVDADEKPELSRRLLRGNSIPQLVLYMRIGRKWRRTQLTGVHSPEDVRGFLRREIAAGRAETQDAPAGNITSHNDKVTGRPVSAQR